RLTDIINFLPDAILAIDLEGKVIAWNRAIEEMTGCPAQSMLGKGDYEYAIPFYGVRRPILVDFVSNWDERIQKQYSFIKKEGDTLYTETSAPSVRGQTRILWGKAGPLYDTNGNLVGAIESIRDITESKWAAEAIEESEKRFRAIFNSTFQFAGLMTPDGIMIEVNQTALAFAGITAEEVIGKPFWEARWWHGNEARVNQLKEAVARVARGEFVRYEVELRGAGDTTAIIDFSLKPIFDPEGRVSLLIPEGRDITLRKEAEKELFMEKEKLLVLSEHAPFGTTLIDRKGNFLYINPKFKELFGYDLNDVPDGKSWFSKAYPDAAYRHTVIAAWVEDIKSSISGGLQQRIFDVTCKDGSVKVSRFVPVFLGNGDTIMVCEDITERKRLEAQLMNAQKMEAVGTLTGGIAHDFNNILMGIQGYTSLMLLDIGRDHPHYDRLKSIEEQVKSAADLTRQLLGFARGGKYVVEPLKMNDIVDRTSTMFGRTKKELAIHTKYDHDLWVVEADRSQIEQVFLNLYLNAWQAMPAGGDLSLETANTIIEEDHGKTYSVLPGRYVRISVTDTGPGMDEKTKQRIFEPFFTTKELGRGTGLGLAMVYGIVKNHNGFIDVISEPGKGTTFVLYLPASKKDPSAQKTPAGEILRGSERILLVDDEPNVLSVSKVLLQTLGYTVHAMGSGQEAITFFKENNDRIDLVICDMIMPGFSGGETFDLLREINPSVRTILSSGYSLDGQARKIMDKGCSGFIQKPFNLIDLSRKIREVLDS
ncbi:MAG: PAS domain S-box protein, partial [Chitinivibrionia bacterium]|nr:PAS domain S-box protein [Chitinivibrionia bacterium]